MTKENPVIVWFRSDLRIADNPALTEACKTGQPIICVYISETDAERQMGGASQWWLHHSLIQLSRNLEIVNLSLRIFKGKALEILQDLCKKTNADQIFWNRRYAKDGIERDTLIKEQCKTGGIEARSFKAGLLHEPWEIESKTGGYYKVFTPYWKAVIREANIAPALPVPESAKNFNGDIDSLSIEDLELLPTRPDWGSKVSPYWTPGSQGALDALDDFLDGPVDTYKTDRDRPDKRGTSRLSPHLAFGEISPRQIWYITHDRTESGDKFLSEIGWREFSYTLLYYNPDLATDNFKSEFDAFEWNNDTEHLERWQRGQTGYPFVDAGMRELWATGWQHNRVRMVTASFLIKHLLIDWREGERWFWDTLVDADPANNAASWQWVAGSGADAAPYFRIFNPFSQGEKFDPNGKYVRKWVPEIANLPDKFIHTPWETPESVLKEAGIKLGETYPKPIVEHKFARERALDAYKASRE